MITRFADNHEKALAAPATLMGSIDDDKVVFLGQIAPALRRSAQASSDPLFAQERTLPADHTAPAPALQSSTRKPKEKCSRCKRTCDMCDFNPPCASCSNSGVSDQCYYIHMAKRRHVLMLLILWLGRQLLAYLLWRLLRHLLYGRRR